MMGLWRHKDDSGDSQGNVDSVVSVLIHTPFASDNFTDFANKVVDITTHDENIIDQFSEQMKEMRLEAFLSVYQEDSTSVWSQMQLSELEIYTDLQMQAENQGEPIDEVMPELPPEYGPEMINAEQTQEDISSINDTLGDIASTWLQSFLMTWLVDSEGDLGDAFISMIPSFDLFMNETATDKADTISNVTVQRATDDAQRSFVRDTTQNGEVLTTSGVQSLEDVAQEAGVDYELVIAQLEGMYVAVLPPESSSDICSEYAGNVYRTEDIDEIPPFPIHPHCPHEIILLTGLPE